MNTSSDVGTSVGGRLDLLTARVDALRVQLEAQRTRQDELAALVTELQARLPADEGPDATGPTIDPAPVR